MVRLADILGRKETTGGLHGFKCGQTFLDLKFLIQFWGNHSVREKENNSWTHHRDGCGVHQISLGLITKGLQTWLFHQKADAAPVH